MQQQNGPWIIRERVQKYKTPWVEVLEDKVIRPDGAPGIFSVVKLLPGVSVLPIDEEGNVYLLEEFKYALGFTTIETASGGLDPGEEPKGAARRELKEELGEAQEIIDLGVVHPFTNMVNAPAYLFLAKELHFSEHQREGTEVMKLVKMPFTEAVQMVLDGKIVHALAAYVS